MSATLDTDAAEAREQDWLALPEPQFEAMHEDAYWALCQEEPESAAAMRNVMTIVLLEQIDALREAVRDGAITADAAAASMRSDFAMGYLFGLVAGFADACGLSRTDRLARAAHLDVHATVFGWRAGPAILDRQSERGVFDATGDYAAGMAAALHDMLEYRRWLGGEERHATTGLRDGLLRQRRMVGLAGLRLH